MEHSVQNDSFHCRVTELHNIEPHDHIHPWLMFSLDISTRFLSSFHHHHHHHDDDQFNCSSRETILVQRQLLLSEEQENPRSTVHDILVDTGVPPFAVHEAVIDMILDTARRMAADTLLTDRKILRLRVHVDVFNVLDDGVGDGDVVMVPASDSSIKALEEVGIEKMEQCVICLQEISIGSKAICMPCSHRYHPWCIDNWLRTSGVCPVCRFKLV